MPSSYNCTLKFSHNTFPSMRFARPDIFTRMLFTLLMAIHLHWNLHLYNVLQHSASFFLVKCFMCIYTKNSFELVLSGIYLLRFTYNNIQRFRNPSSLVNLSPSLQFYSFPYTGQIIEHVRLTVMSGWNASSVEPCFSAMSRRQVQLSPQKFDTKWPVHKSVWWTAVPAIVGNN